MKLFQYAILYTGKITKADEEAGKGPEFRILKDITTVAARDEREVLLKAAKEIPEDYSDKLDRVEVAVRPF